MKELKFFAAGLVGLALLAGFSSCSDDDEETGDTINTEAVFTNGWPKSAPGIRSITRNAEGLVTAMETEESDVTFESHNIKTRADGEAYVLMTVGYMGEKEYEAKLTLNGKGFVTRAEGTEYIEDYTDPDNWSFGYNSDGQLNYVHHVSTDEDEETRITYSGGDITKVVETDNEGDGGYTFNFSYTSDKVTTPIENKGGIMLYDGIFEVDLDQMDVLYFAGLLGKATKHLPVSEYAPDEDYTYRFEWGVNNAGLPEWVWIDGYREYFEW